MRSGFLARGILVILVGTLIVVAFSDLVGSYVPPVQNVHDVLFQSLWFIPSNFPISLVGSVLGSAVVVFGFWTVSRAASPHAPSDVSGMLGGREHIQLYIQQENSVPSIGKKSWALTNLRIIERRTYGRNLTLKRDYMETSYRDITRSTLHEGFSRSTINCELDLDQKDTGPQRKTLVLDKLLKSEARKADGWIRENVSKSSPPSVENPIDPAKQESRPRPPSDRIVVQN